MDYLLQKSFPPEQINKLLERLINAEDVKMAKTGERYTTPNWPARTEGFRDLLRLKRFTTAKDGDPAGVPITKITFNVVNNVTVAKPPVLDVEESPSS